MVARSRVPAPSDRSGGQYASRRVLHRQALLARRRWIAARPGRAARVRDASARTNESHATIAGAGADGTFLGESVPPKTRVVGNHAARPLYAASLCSTRLGGRHGGLARSWVRVSGGMVCPALRVSISADRFGNQVGHAAGAAARSGTVARAR